MPDRVGLQISSVTSAHINCKVCESHLARQGAVSAHPGCAWDGKDMRSAHNACAHVPAVVGSSHSVNSIEIYHMYQSSGTCI